VRVCARLQGCKRWVREGRSGNEYDMRKCKMCAHMPCCLLIYERHLPAFEFPAEFKRQAREQMEIGWNDETTQDEEPAGEAAGGAGTSGAHGGGGEGE